MNKSDQEHAIQRRTAEILKEKYNTFMKLERESIDNNKRKYNKKSFKEIHQNIDYVFENFEKFIKLSKKIKKSKEEKYEKLEKINSNQNTEKTSNL